MTGAIYLDHFAAAPPCEAALRAMADASTECWANPHSVHAAGRRSRALLEGARDAVAAALGVEPLDVVLTSGGTEAISLGVLGVGGSASRVVTTDVEHPAVGRAVDRLGGEGVVVERLATRGGTPPDPSEVERALEPGALLAVQWVNHETGMAWPLPEWTERARARGARTFVDATQALGRIPVDLDGLGADAVAFASHKMGGPAGAGALWVRRGLDLPPLMAGGEQERGRRPGTPDVLAAVGFGAACGALSERIASAPRIAELRDRIEDALVDCGAVVNRGSGPRVAAVTNVSVRGWKGEALVAALDLEGLCVASGPACSSGTSEPSPVLRAMAPDEPWRAKGALRISLGPETTAEEVGRAIDILRRVLERPTTKFE